MPKKCIEIEPPETICTPLPVKPLSFNISLLTPMVGGGVDSWIPNKQAPIRSQSIKGHLRFWWRTMQTGITDPTVLREREKILWGHTGLASQVRIRVDNQNSIKTKVLARNPNGTINFDNLPDYVLFPFQSFEQPNVTLIEACFFELIVECPSTYQEELKKTVMLWILFGGIGARTRRGCGSLFCPEIMNQFRSSDDINAFLNQFQNSQAPSPSPLPSIIGSRFHYKTIPVGDVTIAWKSFLDRYKIFRQGPGCGRNHGTGPRPGRTRWPEADAIRRITRCLTGTHPPEHPAGNWFPRGAYGLPIQTEFKNDRSDPSGKYMLKPDGLERWPSPAILKIIKLGNEKLLEVCLILNSKLPDNLELYRDSKNIHTLSATEMPLNYTGKTMPVPGPIHTVENPHDGLIRHLGLI